MRTTRTGVAARMALAVVTTLIVLVALDLVDLRTPREAARSADVAEAHSAAVPGRHDCACPTCLYNGCAEGEALADER